MKYCDVHLCQLPRFHPVGVILVGSEPCGSEDVLSFTVINWFIGADGPMGTN